MRRMLEKLAGLYASGAVIFTNAVAVFVLANVAAQLALSLRKGAPANDPVSSKYGMAKMREAYPHLKDGEIKQLLRETWSRPYVYEPFTMFSETAYRGRYVNIMEPGFRHTHNQGPWPPDRGTTNVFLFGGSTAFGYGVEDDQTIASHLQECLRRRLSAAVNVYNCGRGTYFSTQERILFEKLVSSGNAPDVAVFLDGLNEFFHSDGNPQYGARFRKCVSGEGPGLAVIYRLPFLRLLGAGPGEDPGADAPPGDVRHDDPGVLGEIIGRYLENKKITEAVAAAYGVKPVFVWQPVPTYKYDLKYHPFAGGDLGKHAASGHGYALMEKRVAAHPAGGNFLWAADAQVGVKRSLYVDQVHYSGEFSRRLAEMISEFLARTGF